MAKIRKSKTTATEISSDAYRKTFKKNKWFFSLGAVGHDMVYSLVVSYLLTFVQFGYRLSVHQYLVISLCIGVLGRIWDAITDPLMGLIIQKCHFKLGKYRPWIFIGAVLTGMFTVFLFNTQLEGWSFVVYIVAMNLLWETAYTINDISYWSMLPSLSSDTKERNLVSTMTLLCAGAGGGIIQGLITVFQTGNLLRAYSSISVVSAVAIIVTQGLTAFFVKEKPQLIDKANTDVSFKKMFSIIFKNKQLLVVALGLGLYVIGNGIFVSLLYNIYYIEIGYNGDIFVVLVVFAFFSTLLQILFPYLSKVMSKKKILLLSSLSSIFGYFLFLIIGWTNWLPFNLITILISGFFIYSGNSLINLVTVIHITNCVEYNEYISGERNEAIVSTIRPFVTKMSTAIKYGFTSLILIISGVFTLSQNVSTIEIQKTYFSKISETGEMTRFEVQKLYLSTIQTYALELEELTDEQDRETRMEQIDRFLSSDPVLSPYKLEAEYLGSCALMYLLEDETVLGQIKDVDLGLLSEEKAYSLSITGYYFDEEGNRIRYNAGNQCFKDISDLKERVMLRALATILPMLCLGACWFVQEKYYIIDEPYYDRMIGELEERNRKKEE